jgi:hypothetical protein
MSTNNRANAGFDLPLLGTYESGSAYAIDAAQYKMSKLAKGLGTKPASFEPFSIHPLQVVVGGGGSYPAGFLAVGGTYLEGAAKAGGSCPHGDSLLQYEKSSARSPWRIVLEPDADEGRFVTLAADNGIAAPLTAAERSAADRVPQRVATDLQDYEVSGRLGPFSSGDFNGTCWSMPDPRKELLQTEASGLSGRELYRPASGTVAYLIAGGGTAGSASATAGRGSLPAVLVLFTLRFENQLFAPAGSPIEWREQPASYPDSVLLRAGRYSAVDERGDLELAAELEGDGRISIVGEYDGVTSVTGTRAEAAGPGGTLADSPIR